MLIQLRNPWGKGEWEGAWSDKSDEWKQNGTVRGIIRPKDADDGAFWMSFTDFERIFTGIDICARRTGGQPADPRMVFIHRFVAIAPHFPPLSHSPPQRTPLSPLPTTPTHNPYPKPVCRPCSATLAPPRLSGIPDLQLDLKEADGCVANCMGPLKGCCVGCLTFFCCCRGCKALYGNTGGQEVTVDIKGDEKAAFDDNASSRIGQMIEGAADTVQNI